jgi:hypothetical protein
MMLISQNPDEFADEQGCSAADFAQLRRQLDDPASLDGRGRQRLMELARRLARVRAMGDKYLRVTFSENSEHAISEVMHTVGT